MRITLADLYVVKADPTKHDISAFDCGDADLNDFLKNDCFHYQREYLSHTRLVFNEGKQLVAFLTLLNDSILLKTKEKKKLIGYRWIISSFPAVKIGRLAIAKKFQRQGIGKELVKYTIGLVVRLNKELHIGSRFITLDAYPVSIPFYERCGFVFNLHPDYSAKTHPSMRYDLIKGPRL